MEAGYQAARDVIGQVEQVILGKEDRIREIMTAFLAGGHVLLEDIPGVGKTTLAMAFSRAMGLSYRRVQFTPDVLPSDLTGFSIYRREEEKFVYQPGSVFCNLLLADEINRTSPKTQSALLEVMEERRVTVDGVTREVPAPFLVIDTQNPAGSTGTQYLPEAQVDRFMVSLSLGYPDFESELAMAKSISAEDRLEKVETVLDDWTLLKMQEEIHDVFVRDRVYAYILELIRATRENPHFERGASPPGHHCPCENGKGGSLSCGEGLCDPGGRGGTVLLCVGPPCHAERRGPDGGTVRQAGAGGDHGAGEKAACGREEASMKKAGLLILILLTAYIGGIYEDPALMALAVAELLLAVVMWLLAGYMAGRLELQIPAARILAVRGQTFQCWVTVKSRGILPVSRFVVRIGSRYEGGGRREDKKVYGGAMPGESRLWVEERADHCGIRTFQAEEIRVYDYLALFSRKRKLGQAWEALILPPDMEMRVRLEEAGAGR